MEQDPQERKSSMPSSLVAVGAAGSTNHPLFSAPSALRALLCALTPRVPLVLRSLRAVAALCLYMFWFFQYFLARLSLLVPSAVLNKKGGPYWSQGVLNRASYHPNLELPRVLHQAICLKPGSNSWFRAHW